MLQKNFIKQQKNINHLRIGWIPPLIHSDKIDKHVLSVLIGNDECYQPFESGIFNIKIKSKADRLIIEKGQTMNDRDRKVFVGNMDVCELTEGGKILQVIPEYSNRTGKSAFNKALLRQYAALPEIKIIELDLSRASKANHQSFLKSKIGNITGINTSNSFSTFDCREFFEAEGMLHFVNSLKTFSNGKPVGIKLFIQKKEFMKYVT